MIAPSLIAEVRRLLAEGKHSQRAIARMTGVSRGTITAVANGTRPDYVPRVDEDPLAPQGPPRRCPQCGGLVYLPCRACQLREHPGGNVTFRRRWPDRRPDTELALDLRDEHRRRYEAVHLQRMLAGEPPTEEGE